MGPGCPSTAGGSAPSALGTDAGVRVAIRRSRLTSAMPSGFAGDIDQSQQCGTLAAARLSFYSSRAVSSARRMSSLSWKSMLRAAAATGAGSAVVPYLAAARGLGVVADRQPGLGEVAFFEVVAGGGAAHPGGHPAGVDRVADHGGPAAGDGQGERGDEKLAVAVGLGAVPAAGVPVEVVRGCRRR